MICDALFSELKGKTLVSIERTSMDGDILIFKCSDGVVYEMYHDDYCCEDVHIDDICGELDDLLNEPVLFAQEESNQSETLEGSQTYTFYKLATNHGFVTIRWYGASNGYYSEEVSFYKIIEDKA